MNTENIKYAIQIENIKTDSINIQPSDSSSNLTITSNSSAETYTLNIRTKNIETKKTKKIKK